MNRSTRILSAVLFAVALPLAAQVNDTYVIPAAASAPGAYGTQWKTQFSVFNPQLQHDLTVRVVFLPTGGGQGMTAKVPVGSNAIRYSDDILYDLFGVSGTGALLVATFAEDNPGVPNTVLDQSFLVTTDTYNDSRNGTYGQTIPGIWTGLQDFATDGISGVVHGIRNSTKNGWRTNVGAVNLGRCTAHMLVSVYDENGATIVDHAPFDIPPLGHMQDRLENLHGTHGGSVAELERGTLEFFIDDPCVKNADNAAVVFPYTSTVDQLSGDPAYQTPVLLASAATVYGAKVSNAEFAAAQLTIGKKIDKTVVKGIADRAVDYGVVELKNSPTQRNLR